ncbi:MAG TPA: ProQ/FINO family protein [Aquabacterium sp.]|uniref:ProQ/FINO family protein n=1 Tax=Aquabacterium sp. TaxID=1872578 RepID=UPI002E31D669|nr:ProQ/FINO family protein [Aquabacterium sp.]HEX5356090.1 ProQ/FINO family protein [Aquabacterium sp.]
MSSISPAPADQAAEPPAPDTVPEAVPAAAATADSAAAPAQAQQPESPAATAARLAELFPALFKGQPKPLKLRIQVDIQERAPGVFSKQALSAFFRRYTGATSYLIAVSKATQRFDLDGQPAGELTDEHRKVAADELVRRRANANAKREAEQAERRQRASLLRDFETTKLTTANFCALKGVAPEALDGLLAQARAEALEDAQNPQRHHHGHGRPEHGRRDGQGRPGGHGGKPGNGGPRREGQGPRREGQPRGDGPRGEQRRAGGPREGGQRDGARRDGGNRGPRGQGGQGGAGGGQGGQGGGEQAKG